MRRTSIMGMVMAAGMLAGPARADVLVLKSGSGERPMTCVIQEETESAYRVRVKFGASSIPKDRVIRVVRHSPETNASLLTKWAAPKTKNKDAETTPGLVDGPIPPVEQTLTAHLNPQALLDKYGLDGMQDGFEYQAFCPPGGKYCSLLVRGVAEFQRDVLKLRKGDRLLGIDGQRFPQGPAAEMLLQRVVTAGLGGGTQTLHLTRDDVRWDIIYGP